MRPILFAMVVGLLSGCSMHAGSSEFDDGLEESRAGLTAVDRGIAAYRAGERTSGMSEMEKGLAKMATSMTTMRDSMSMMSSGMTSKCCAGSAQMMGALDSALERLRAGHAMMVDADPANDGAGLDRMDSAKKAAADSMTTMGSTMSSCM